MLFLGGGGGWGGGRREVCEADGKLGENYLNAIQTKLYTTIEDL